MEKRPNHLLRVHPYMYLSQHDDRFYEKYLRFFPNDAVKMFEYGMWLEKQGEWLKAMALYEKATNRGYRPARQRLHVLRSLTGKMDHDRIQVMEKEQKAKMLFWLALLLLFLSFLLLMESHYDWIGRLLKVQVTEHYFYEKEVIHHPPRERVIDLEQEEDPVSTTTPDQLPWIVLDNALHRYRQMEGKYPDSIQTLMASYPDNWLSFFPEDLVPEAEKRLQSLKGGQASIAENGVLELHFYPDANRLAVAKGEEILALYPVAAGKQELPFAESLVTSRIVRPNGGDGLLGTRGLELHDRYAIHGTNAEESIGQNVTHGCIRMHNEDIETLYPYIAKGTPFLVKDGVPGQPTFADGLPAWDRQRDWTREEAPNVRFSWRG